MTTNPQSDIFRMLQSRSVDDARKAKRNNRQAMRTTDGEELDLRKQLDDLLGRWISAHKHYR